MISGSTTTIRSRGTSMVVTGGGKTRAAFFSSSQQQKRPWWWWSSSTTTTMRMMSSSSSASSLLANRLNGLDNPTVWHEFSPLANKHEAINLGQGFPDWEPPTFVIDAMMNSISSPDRNANQYARPNAHLPLANVLSDEYNRRWNSSTEDDSSSTTKITIDPITNIATAVGCTQALYCSLQGLINPGDEVLLLEPAFDIYNAQVRMAGGVPIYCPLRPSSTSNDDNDNDIGNDSVDIDEPSASDYFTLDMNEFESKFTDRTRVFILNTPHNPTGKLFSKSELENISKIILKHNSATSRPVIVISDEVYEHLVYDVGNEPHLSIATIDDMFDHTLTLSSSGKTFSCTGWKVGWAIGPQHLIRAVTAVQQWVNFSAPTPNQDAIAQALQIASTTSYGGYDTYYHYLAAEYKRKREILLDTLRIANMKPIISPGTFFIMADTTHSISNFHTDIYNTHYKTMITDSMPCKPMPYDWAYSRYMTEYIGVTAIPPSAFYSKDNIHLCSNLLRFAFCKNDRTLLEAKNRFSKYFS